MRIAKRICSAVFIVALFAFPLLAQYYVPVVEWNGTHFRVMNGSGSYDLQPVDSPVVDVPFSNSNNLVVWNDGTDYHAFVVDSFHDRVQFFDTNISRMSETEADFTWTAGAAAAAGEYDDNALFLNNDDGVAGGDVVRGSEVLYVNNTLFSRVSSLAGYTASDYVYTIVYEGADADNAGVLTFPANTLTSTDEIDVVYAMTTLFNSALSDDVDHELAAAAVNGTVNGSPFEINETIPDNPTTALAFENLVSIAYLENSAAADVADIYLLDQGEIGTQDPQLHAFQVEHDAAATFEWVDTYDGPLSNPQDVAIEESGDNTLTALAAGAGFTDWTSANGPDYPAAQALEVQVRNNALVTNHAYTITVVDDQDAAGVDIAGTIFRIDDTTVGNTIGYYTAPTSIASAVITWDFIPGLRIIWQLGDGTAAGEDQDLDFQTNDVFVINPQQAGATEAAINEYIFICDTGNDRIKVLKGADNHETGANGNRTAGVVGVDYFADDNQRKDYYDIIGAGEDVPNLTYVSALRSQEDDFDIYTHSSVSGDTMEWTRVDNFAGSSSTDYHYMYDYDTQVILFGDGNFGRIPAENDSIFAWYTPCLDVLDYGSTGSADGRFNVPSGVTANYNVAQGWYDVYVADTGNDRIAKLKFTPEANNMPAMMEWVTSWTATYSGSVLDEPTDLFVADNEIANANDIVYLFVADTGNDRVIVYRDNDAEREGDGGDTAPTFSTSFGGSGTGFGQYAHPTGISAIYNATSTEFEIYVADAERNFVVKYQVGDTPEIDVDYSNIASYGYLPTGSYTYNKNTAWTYMARTYPVGSYIQFLYSDTTTAGQASPILCSSTQYAATTTQFVWNFADTPTGAPADGLYYLYARLYDSNGAQLDEDKATTTLEINSNLMNGIGAFDDFDGDAYFYVQNDAIRQFTLDAIYPDSVAAISYNGTFPADKVQILSIVEGPAWETVQNQGVIFESDFDNTLGTFSVNTAVLGSNTGLVSGPPIYTIAVITVQVNSDAVTPTTRYYNGTVDVATGSWTDFNGVALAQPNLNDISLRIGYLGDIADPASNRGTMPNMIPNPDGEFGIDDIVVFTMAWNGLNNTWDPIADLAPYTGTVPNLWSSPDGVLDVNDLMAFTLMFNWYQSQNFTTEKTIHGMPDVDTVNPEYIDIVKNRIGDKWIVEVHAEDVEALMATELNFHFDSRNIRLDSYRDGGFLSGSDNSIFRGYENDNSLRLFSSRLNPEDPSVDGTGALATLEFTVIGDEEADLFVSFDMRDKDGEVVEKGTFSAMGLDDTAVTLPATFSLSQNFPNPFNPTTKIDFSLPEASHVTLRVYNVLGELVTELVNGHMEAGAHRISWNAVDVLNGNVQASGIYFYKLTAGEFTSTRKMLLFK